MKKRFKELNSEISDLFYESAISGDSFRKHGVYDPEVLNEWSLVSKVMRLMGEMVDEIEILKRIKRNNSYKKSLGSFFLPHFLHTL